MFGDVMVGSDCDKFEAALWHVVSVDWGVNRPDEAPFFVSFNPVASTIASPMAKRCGRTLIRTPYTDVVELVEQSLKKYGREYQDLALFTVEETIRRLSAVDRKLSTPGGSLLMAGRTGVGRRALVLLTAYIQRLEVTTIQVRRGYGVKHFKADLKTFMTRAGVEGERLVVILEDHQLVDPSFIEMVNSLLSTGEVPGLFQGNELEPLLAPIKDEASESGWRGSLYDFFIARIQANLRVVLLLDCSEATFGVVCESNPALYNKCSILWMDRWQASSMVQIPQLLLGANVLDNLSDSKRVIDTINFVHSEVPGAAPRQFTAFCETCVSRLVACLPDRLAWPAPQSENDQSSRVFCLFFCGPLLTRAVCTGMPRSSRRHERSRRSSSRGCKPVSTSWRTPRRWSTSSRGRPARSRSS